MNSALGRLSSALLFLLLAACAPEPQSEPESVPPSGMVNANGIDFEYFVEGEGRACMVVGDALTPSRAVSAQLKEHLRFVFLSSRMTTHYELCSWPSFQRPAVSAPRGMCSGAAI